MKRWPLVVTLGVLGLAVWLVWDTKRQVTDFLCRYHDNEGR